MRDVRGDRERKRERERERESGVQEEDSGSSGATVGLSFWFRRAASSDLVAVRLGSWLRRACVMMVVASVPSGQMAATTAPVTLQEAWAARASRPCRRICRARPVPVAEFAGRLPEGRERPTPKDGVGRSGAFPSRVGLTMVAVAASGSGPP
ncbi:hypothetical protein C2845_PM07G20150 [Panicum miliaceum]|uniref:Uncharacterized protein n=1 Tax=Panicum miliaceum TaxID=4540 RepID=A0A3L6SS68_PANMI|nr:hypothetical protein C2845_PM07G20150 [Panicum miliaceum]